MNRNTLVCLALVMLTFVGIGYFGLLLQEDSRIKSQYHELYNSTLTSLQVESNFWGGWFTLTFSDGHILYTRSIPDDLQLNVCYRVLQNEFQQIKLERCDWRNK